MRLARSLRRATRPAEPEMRAADWGVVLAGSAAIVWVNWYFLFAGRDETPSPPPERDASPRGPRAVGDVDTRR